MAIHTSPLAATCGRWGLPVDVADLTGGDLAVFSPDRAYRYALTRTWDPARPTAVWMMLNPSTADAFTADPTIRRCLAFSTGWGCGSVVVLNLFGLRATDPAVMLAHPDPVGEDNDRVIGAVQTHMDGDIWIAAWGVHGAHHGRDTAVRAWLAALGIRPHCLGTTKAGQPRHPLYVPAGTPLAYLPTELEPTP